MLIMCQKVITTRVSNAEFYGGDMESQYTESVRFRETKIKNEQSGSNSRALALAVIRERLAISSWERQRAVSNFPLIVAQIANDMKRTLDLAEIHGQTKEVAEYLEHCETIIREAYRSTFGRELGQ